MGYLVPDAAVPGSDPISPTADPYTGDLKKGMFDDVATEKFTSRNKGADGHVAGTAIKELQEDLKSFRIRGIGVVDGDFGGKTETAVKKFQEYALDVGRTTDHSSEMVEVTYFGQVTGIVDDLTKEEITLWKDRGYMSPDTGPAVGVDVWMSIAEEEIGVKEIAGSEHSDRVLEYHATTGGVL